MAEKIPGDNPFEHHGYKELFRQLPAPVVFVEAGDRVVRCNHAFSELFGFTEDDILGKSLNVHIVPEEQRSEAETIDNEVLGEERTQYFETTRIRKDGSKVDVAITATPIDVAGRRFIAAIYQDIGERKQLEAALRANEQDLRRYTDELRESETKFRSIAENAFDAITIVDFDGYYLYGNPSEGALVQEAPEDLAGKKAFDYIHPDDRRSVEAVFNEFRRGERTQARDEVRVITSDGNTVWTDYRASLLYDHEGKPASVLVVDRDITDYKRDQEQIRALLEQKELLLKESHHRIKNNMATISSLLSYHAGRLRDKEAAEVLEDSARRTQGMAMLYDRLYRSEQYNTLNAREYLDALAGDTINLSDPHNTISVNINAEDFSLEVNVLAPLGIILTELVTNSVKHAFDRTEQNRISVRFSKRNRTARLEFADNGVGIPESIVADPGTNAGFGLQLIRMLVEQINGNLSIENDNGTRYIIEFPVGNTEPADAVLA